MRDLHRTKSLGIVSFQLFFRSLMYSIVIPGAQADAARRSGNARRRLRRLREAMARLRSPVTETSAADAVTLNVTRREPACLINEFFNDNGRKNRHHRAGGVCRGDGDVGNKCFDLLADIWTVGCSASRVTRRAAHACRYRSAPVNDSNASKIRRQASEHRRAGRLPATVVVADPFRWRQPACA